MVTEIRSHDKNSLFFDSCPPFFFLSLQLEQKDLSELLAIRLDYA